MDKKHQVEYTYIAFYAVMLVIGAGLSWVFADANPRSYRKFMLPLGLFTGLLIFGGIMLAEHYYPGG